jgi:predicted CopG family antitoxin
MRQNETNLFLDPTSAPRASNSFYMRAYNHYFESQKVSTVATTASSERRRRSRLKRIVVSEHNYLALKRLGHAGDSFNDVISKLLRIYWNHREKQQELQRQQQENGDQNSSSELLPPPSVSEMFDVRSRQQEADLIRLLLRKSSSRNHQTIKQESNNARES